jgi:hypothetical protein
MGKGKFVPVLLVMNGKRRSAPIAPHVINLGARGGERSPPFSDRCISGGRSPLEGGFESRFGLFEEEKNLLPHQRIKPGFLDGLAQIGKRRRHIQFLLCFEMTSCPPSPHHAFVSTNHLSSEQPKLVKRMTRKHRNYSTDKLHPLAIPNFLFRVFSPVCMVLRCKQNIEIHLPPKPFQYTSGGTCDVILKSRILSKISRFMTDRSTGSSDGITKRGTISLLSVRRLVSK